MQDKKPYLVTKGDEKGEIWIENVLHRVGDTVWLTEGQARFRVGASIEGVSAKTAALLPGEHGETRLRPDGDTTGNSAVQLPEDDVEPRRSQRAPRTRPVASVPQSQALGQEEMVDTSGAILPRDGE